MSADISGLTITELKELVAEAKLRIADLQEEQKQDIFAKMRALAAEVDMTVGEVATQCGEKKTRAKKATKVKFRNPDDVSQTWAGRGRKPVWLQKALESGRKLEEFAI